MKKIKNKGFSAIEVLISLIIVSILLVSFIPVMTKKKTKSINISSTSGLCTDCSDPNCKICKCSGECIECKPVYFDEETNQCSECTGNNKMVVDNKCVEISCSNTTIINHCPDKTEWNEETQTCECKEGEVCEPDNTNDDICPEGYIFNGTKCNCNAKEGYLECLGECVAVPKSCHNSTCIFTGLDPHESYNKNKNFMKDNNYLYYGYMEPVRPGILCPSSFNSFDIKDFMNDKEYSRISCNYMLANNPKPLSVDGSGASAINYIRVNKDSNKGAKCYNFRGHSVIYNAF